MHGRHFLPSLYLCSLNCVIFAQACQTQSIHKSHCSVQCFVLGYVIKDESDYSFVISFQSMKRVSMCFSHNLSFISELKASD